MATSFIARHALHALEMSTGPVVESVELEGFRGIRACEEPVRLSRFTVLIGRNNAGKTSVLEALALFPFPSLRLGTVEYGLPLLGSWPDVMAVLHGGLQSLVYGYVGEASITYMVHGRKIKRALSKSGSIVSWVDEEYTPSEGYISSIASLLNIGTYDVEKLAFLLPNDSSLLRKIASELSKEDNWSLVEKSGANTAVVRDLISKAVHDRFTEATVRFNSIVLRKELPDGRVIYVKAADLGDGVERVLIYGLWLETYRPKLVLWDDIEASAHPGLVEAVLEWLASRDWQVVLSTHSLDVLDRLVAVEPEGASVVVLRKGADDVLRPRVLGLEELREMLESHVDPRKVVDIL